MKTVNKVILLGRAGGDPEVKQTGSGTTVTKLSLATTEREKKDGEWQDRTEWHTVILWQKLGEIAGEYIKKGDQVYVEGRNQTRKYEKDGVTKYFTEVIASELVLLGGTPGGSKTEKKEAKAEDNDFPF